MMLKGCPRCDGDLMEQDDQYGQYLRCMQCGWCKDILPPSSLRTEAEEVDED